MSFGKLYGFEDNSRTRVCQVAAKANNLDIELVETFPSKGDPSYLKINPLDRVPSFVGANGFTLTECIAISVYFASQNEKTTLLGKTKQDYASILRWMSFGNSEVLVPLGTWFRPLVGRDPYNKKTVEESMLRCMKSLDVLEKHLATNTFFVGERLTLADIFMASMISRGFQYVLGSDWREANAATTRWFDTVVNQPMYKAVVPDPIYIEEGLKNVPPKKEEKAAQPKKEAPKKDAPAQEEDKPAPKPKHPLESLPKPTLVLDEWKRTFSNEDIRSVALPWFWEHYKPDEYSLWRVEYKYNDELTMTFMSNNLIGGFFARLEASRKFIFGAASVYGETNDSLIRGAFVIRGQEAPVAFDVAPDWESYSFTKLDHNSADDKKFIENEWAQDTDATVDGKTYEWAEGKVFK